MSRLLHIASSAAAALLGASMLTGCAGGTLATASSIASIASSYVALREFVEDAPPPAKPQSTAYPTMQGYDPYGQTPYAELSGPIQDYYAFPVSD